MKKGSQKKEMKKRENIILSFVKIAGYCMLNEIDKELKMNGVDLARQNLHIQLSGMFKKGMLNRKVVVSNKVTTKTFLYSLGPELVNVKQRHGLVSQVKLDAIELAKLWPATCNNFPPVSCLI